MRTSTAILGAFLLVAAPVARGAEPVRKKGAPIKAPDLKLPTFDAIPKGEGLRAPKAAPVASQPTVTATDATYQVLQVTHAKAFIRTPKGAQPAGGPLEAIPLSGEPLSTEKFSTVIRIKCPQRASAGIDVVILDGRGNTAMTASGELNFRGVKQDEVEYTIDWDPTPTKAGGDYQVLIRVAGQVLGTWPLKMAERR